MHIFLLQFKVNKDLWLHLYQLESFLKKIFEDKVKDIYLHCLSEVISDISDLDNLCATSHRKVKKISTQ